MSTSDYGLGYIRDGLEAVGHGLEVGLTNIANAIKALDKTERIVYDVKVDATYDPEQIGEAIRAVSRGLRPE